MVETSKPAARAGFGNSSSLAADVSRDNPEPTKKQAQAADLDVAAFDRLPEFSPRQPGTRASAAEEGESKRGIISRVGGRAAAQLDLMLGSVEVGDDVGIKHHWREFVRNSREVAAVIKDLFGEEGRP
jgi:hypothetical protein